MRQLFWRTLLTVMLVAGGVSRGEAQSLVRQTTAARYGLTRAWYAQIGSALVNGQLEHINYDEGMVLVQNRRGMLTALDGETGRKLWSTQVGPQDRSSTEPAANDTHVVVVCGSNLYVLSRADGSILWRRQIRGAPGAGPGITATHVFVPTITGLVEGFDLEKGAKQTPWNYQSAGRVVTPPTTTAATVCWATDLGFVYAADPAAAGISYRLETRGEVESRPAYWTPHLFACSNDGYVYAMKEENGDIDWEFSTGETIRQGPVAIEGRVFVVTEFGGMYCLNSADGSPLWHARNIRQFVSASPSRVYATDRVGGLAILDIEQGVRLGTMPLGRVTKALVNRHSDRIFLADGANVVQCLRETPLRSPVVYTPPPPAEKPKAKLKKRGPAVPAEPAVDFDAAPPAAEPAAEPAADSDNPCGTPPPGGPAPDADNPFAP